MLVLAAAIGAIVPALPPVGSSPPSDCQQTVGGKIYDLRPLAESRPVGVAEDAEGRHYTYRVCGNLGTACSWPGDAVPALCQRDGRGNSWDCGSQNKTSWQPLPSGANGFMLSFSGGQDNRTAIISFVWYSANLLG